MRPISHGGPRAERRSRLTKTVFDLELARAATPLVLRILADVSSLRGRLKQNRDRRNSLDVDPLASPSRERFLLDDEAEELRAALRDVVDELHAMGVALLDPVRGAAGFPTLVNGAAAYLVVRAEDGRVAFWRYRDQPRLRPIPDHWSGVSPQPAAVDSPQALLV